MARLVLLPPEPRRNGNAPPTREPEPERSHRPTTLAYIVAGIGALTLFAIVALGLWKLAELITPW